MIEQHEKWMKVALEVARAAAAIDEVPIGACIVDENNTLVAVGHNLTITNSDPTAHAEVVAIRLAATKIANYRLAGMTLYTTIEPCAMCAGTLVNARVQRLVYGARDERYGGVDTHFGIGTGTELNHRFDVVSGVLADECRSLMQDFFKARRK